MANGRQQSGLKASSFLGKALRAAPSNNTNVFDSPLRGKIHLKPLAAQCEIPPISLAIPFRDSTGVRGVRWDRVYGTNLDQVGPNMAKLDQLGQVGRHFAVFGLLRKAPLTNLDQVGPVLFPTVFRALLNYY